jgi:PAS domain S-box-containing protein
VKKAGGRRVGSELRKLAERRLEERGLKASGPAPDVERLVRELGVHEIELEMQNEELRRGRNDLEESQRLFEELFDFAPIGYVVLDPEGKISQANLEMSRMGGVPRQNLARRRFADFADVSCRESLDDFLARRFAGGEQGTEPFELSLLCGEGPKDVRLLAAVIDGREPKALVAIHDVTARKRAERALLEEARKKDEFLAALSHELRNPLSPIRTSLDVLERSAPQDVQARKPLEIIRRQVDHLVGIVDDLLDVTRIARGMIVLQRQTVELGSVIRHTLEDYQSNFDSVGVLLSARLPPEDLFVDADPTRLVQVVGNLLGNALKFTLRGGHVDLVLQRRAEMAEILVRDDGVGIAPEMLGRLFEPFTQAPQSLDRTRGGLGLGLAMVKGLAELHAGAVEAKSAGAGRGATFVVRLPLVPAPAVAAALPVRPRAESRRVLVVEDNVDAADALRDLLELDGHEAQVAYDGPAGIARARQFRPEIVLCDIGLPEMDGYEVARQLRADPDLGRSYLVALSGYASVGDRERSLAAGFDCHVAKPPEADEIERILAEAPRQAL